ncbi:MAG: PQQ-binding-like beta-propeller repeat protein [Phycisphaerae bacterium]|nr:PQQ-binding-like beta-propeller repeat protein [Phycisphaerae bacterium]
MRAFNIAILVPLVFAVAGVAVCYAWLAESGPGDLTLREEFDAPPIKVFEVDLPGKFTPGAGKAPEGMTGSWPQFRNSTMDGVSVEKTPLAETWPAGGPKVVWSMDMGQGYGGAAIHKGRVYILDYDEGRPAGTKDPVDESRKGDVLRCLSLADGSEIWRQWYHIPIRRNHGVSRIVPAVTDRFVVTIGPKGHVLCLDAVTGKAIWSMDLVKEYGAVIPEWYAAQCPLIDTIETEVGDKTIERKIAIIAPGGPKALMLARDCETGEILWTTPNPDNLQMTHSSIMPLEHWGTRMYIYCTSGGVVGVSSEDGKTLWKFEKWQVTPALSPSPVIIGDEKMFFSAAYKAGCLMLEIKQNDDGDSIAVEAFRRGPEIFGSVQQTPLLYEKHLYGVLTNNAGEAKQQMICMNLDGVRLWSSGPENRFELGPYLIADGKILALDGKTGTLTMARATPAGWKMLAKAQVLHGHEAWAPMAIADGMLILRDLTKMICLDLRDPNAPNPTTTPAKQRP